ncbi:MAG: hypothetical protein GKC04_06470 [Methanomicrobiales archaeon]|nr:hypothetical protein [Methanomicrobiales archaeon]
MLSAGSLFFIVVFLFFMQGISSAVIALILYAVLSRLPLPPSGRAALALALAGGCLVLFAVGSGNLGYAAGALVFTLILPLEIAAPLFLLTKHRRFRPCTGYPLVFAALFLAAGTEGVLQTVNMVPLLTSTGYGSPAGLFLARMAIRGIIAILLSGGWFLLLCEAFRRRR